MIILHLQNFFFWETEVAATTRICKSRKSRRYGSGGEGGGGQRRGLGRCLMLGVFVPGTDSMK